MAEEKITSEELINNFDHFYYSLYLEKNNDDKKEEKSDDTNYDKLKKIVMTLDSLFKLLYYEYDKGYLGCCDTKSEEEKEEEKLKSNFKDYNEREKITFEINRKKVSFWFKDTLPISDNEKNDLEKHIEKL